MEHQPVEGRFSRVPMPIFALDPLPMIFPMTSTHIGSIEDQELKVSWAVIRLRGFSWLQDWEGPAVTAPRLRGGEGDQGHLTPARDTVLGTHTHFQDRKKLQSRVSRL